jgi:GNAT superfamily N-acetyltransferase
MPSTSPEVRIVPAQRPEDVSSIRELFQKYQLSLNLDLEFQHFSHELATLPGGYAPPRGRLLLGLINSEVAGCIALRPLSGETCEMKRLFVRPAYRGFGLGHRLCAAVIAEARSIGYTRMVLDTLPFMKDAQAMYERFGFHDIEPYTVNPVPGARFMALELGGA